jgi:hypothetical protein
LLQVDFTDIIRGVLLGSRAQFVDLIDFVAAHRLEPVISGVYDGLGTIANSPVANISGRWLFTRV